MDNVTVLHILLMVVAKMTAEYFKYINVQSVARYHSARAILLFGKILSLILLSILVINEFTLDSLL